jgi:short-subunit dehydrogenase
VNINWIESIIFPKVFLNEGKASAFLRGKTILITGASDGIGKACALLFSKFNVHLILVGRSKKRLDEVAEIIINHNSTASIFVADLYQEEQVDQLIEHIRTQQTPIDIFISNAGKSIQRSLQHSLFRYHDFTRTNALNYLAPVKITLAITPILSKQCGQIVNVSALNVLLLPIAKWAAYQASKTAFDQYCRSNQSEWRKMNIRLKTIYLPLVKTKMIIPNVTYQNMPAMERNEAALRILKLLMGASSYSRPWWAIFPITIGFFIRKFWDRF